MVRLWGSFGLSGWKRGLATLYFEQLIGSDTDRTVSVVNMDIVSHVFG